MNAGFQNSLILDIATSSTETVTARQLPCTPLRTEPRIDRAILFESCIEIAFTGLLFVGCLLFAAAALHLCVPASAARDWGVQGIYGVALTVGAGTVIWVACFITARR